MLNRHSVTKPSETSLNLADIPDPAQWALVFPSDWHDCSDSEATDPRFEGMLEPIYPASAHMTPEQVRDNVVDVTLTQAAAVEDMFLEAIEDYVDPWELMHVLEIPPGTSVQNLVMAAHFPKEPAVGKRAQGVLRELDLAVGLLALRRPAMRRVGRTVYFADTLTNHALSVLKQPVSDKELAAVQRLSQTFSSDKASHAKLVCEEPVLAPEASARVAAVLTAAMVSGGGRVLWNTASGLQVPYLVEQLQEHFPTLTVMESTVNPEPEADMSSESLRHEALTQCDVVVGPVADDMQGIAFDLVVYWHAYGYREWQESRAFHQLFVDAYIEPADTEIEQWAGFPVCILDRKAQSQLPLMDRQTAVAAVLDNDYHFVCYWEPTPIDYGKLAGDQLDALGKCSGIVFHAETEEGLKILLDIDRAPMETVYLTLADLITESARQSVCIGLVSQTPERVATIRAWSKHIGDLTSVHEQMFDDRPSWLSFGRIPGRRPTLKEVAAVIEKLRSAQLV